MMIVQRPYKCTVHMALPSNIYAQHLKDVISVDQEISNKVVKSFTIVNINDGIIIGSHDDDDDDDDDDDNNKCGGDDEKDDMNAIMVKDGDDGCNNLRVLRM